MKSTPHQAASTSASSRAFSRAVSSSSSSFSFLGFGGKTTRAVGFGRLLFVACLCGATAALGVLAHHFVKQSETDLAEAQFESIADRALTEAYGITRRKRLSTLTMATIIGAMHPDAASWPNVFVRDFERIANHLLGTSSGTEMGFVPLVTPKKLSAWEDFAYDYYYNVRGFPNGTAQSSFGRGVWAVDPTLNSTDKRFHDTGASGFPYLAPVFQVDAGITHTLMSNVLSGPLRTQGIGPAAVCSRRLAISGEEFTAQSCGVISDMIHPPPEIKDRGMAAVMIQPIYPSNDKGTLVGFVPAPLVWDEILENIFSHRVSGVDCVISNDKQSFTYRIKEGVAHARGSGEYKTKYEEHRRCAKLTDDEMYADGSPSYKLCVYPTEQLYDVYSTSNPRFSTIGTVLIVLFVSLLFFLYDFLVHREFDARKELLEAKRRFMRYVSHEVRTPLNAVCMGLEVIQGEIAASLGYSSAEELERRADEAASLIELSGRAKASLEWFGLTLEVRSNAQSAVDVLNDLLNFDKIANGELTLELAPIPIWWLIERTVHEFLLPASKKKIRLELCFGDLKTDNEEGSASHISRAEALSQEIRNQKVVGDSARLTQVVRNLLSNALKFTPENETVKITASWLQPDTSPSTSSTKYESFELNSGDHVSFQKGGWIQVAVQDNGVGMSEDQLANLFRDGVQFNVNENQNGGGSGLGCWISKGIVQQHKGTLVASSEGLGKGSTFTMTLPLYNVTDGMDPTYTGETTERTVTPSSQEDIATATTNRSDPLRVLVVDDVASNRKLLGRLLKKRGHTYSEAENGQVAVDMVAAAIRDGNPYDTILLDYEMPVQNGPSAAKEIRSLGSDVFIVGVTGNLLPEDVALFHSCGANAVLPKPFQISDLELLWMEHGVTPSSSR